MAWKCSVCGKGPLTGMQVSHSHRRTKVRKRPNLQRVRILVDGKPRRQRVCTQCIRSNRVTKV